MEEKAIVAHWSWRGWRAFVTMEQRAEDSWSTLQGEVKMRTL